MKMPQTPPEIWFTGVTISDYEPCPMETSLKPPQCEAVQSFLRKLLWVRTQSKVKVSRVMLAYRKERNGGLFAKGREVSHEY